MRKLRVLIAIGAIAGAASCKMERGREGEHAGEQPKAPARQEQQPAQQDTGRPEQQPGGVGQEGQGGETGQFGEQQPQQGLQQPAPVAPGQPGEEQLPGEEQSGQLGQGQGGQAGQPVAVRGEVDEVYGNTAFKITLDQGGEVIVVSPQPMSVEDGNEVAINGQLQPASVAQLEQDLNIDLAPEAEREIQGGTVIVVRSIQLLN
jgi:hypothetical protein